MRTTTWMLWASLLSATGCSSGLSVPYDEIYVSCVTDEDCPREASECRTHRFYTFPSRTEVEEYRHTNEMDGCTIKFLNEEMQARDKELKQLAKQLTAK